MHGEELKTRTGRVSLRTPHFEGTAVGPTVATHGGRLSGRQSRSAVPRPGPVHRHRAVRPLTSDGRVAAGPGARPGAVPPRPPPRVPRPRSRDSFPGTRP